MEWRLRDNDKGWMIIRDFCDQTRIKLKHIDFYTIHGRNYK